MLALEGVRILDLSGGYPPALGTQILGDHGAEIINIDGRPIRRGQERVVQQPDESSEEERKTAAYNTANRNKKSIWLNLKSEEARQIFYRLAEKAAVIVDPFRPGVTKRLGVDYETISKINPGIIYCAVTGYRQDGPYANMAGHDLTYIALAGALNLIGEADRRPTVPLNLLADIAGAALHTTIGILIALTARSKTGKGQYIDISYTDTVVSLLTSVASGYFRTNTVPQRESNRIFISPHYNLYETGDRKLAVGLGFRTSLNVQLAGPTPKGLTAVATDMPLAESKISRHCPLVTTPTAQATATGEDEFGFIFRLFGHLKSDRGIQRFKGCYFFEQILRGCRICLTDPFYCTGRPQVAGIILGGEPAFSGKGDAGQLKFQTPAGSTTPLFLNKLWFHFRFSFSMLG